MIFVNTTPKETSLLKKSKQQKGEQTRVKKEKKQRQ